MALKRFQQPAPFSYLCVPAAAGVQRWGGENVARSKTTRGEGLVPRLGGEQPAHTTISRPIHPKILDTQHRYSGPKTRHLYVENASQIRPNCGVRVREVSSVIGRAGQLHGGAGLE